MDDARIPTSEQLMAEMAWVRRLARALVRDEALADDVAQDTWLVAAAQQPDIDRPLRPWLSRVVINLVRTRRRSDARRDDRHAAVDDDRAVPTPAELVERVEMQRAVVEALLALTEPYRSTVLLHFIEGYSSADIARQLGIPDGTVRRRLKVALDQLRDALRKRTDQPERGWLAALVPLARSPGPAPASASMGVFAMKKIIVAFLLLLLAIVGGVAWHQRGQSRGVGTTSSPVAMLVQGAPKAVVEAVSTTIPPWLSQTGAPPRRIAGRVVFRGIPIAGAKVQLGLDVSGETMPALVLPESASKLLQPIAEVTSAADGTFDFGVQPPASFTVSAAARNFAAAAVAVSNADPRVRSDQLVVALGDCRSRLTGMIADASGGGIAKARISTAGLSGTESDATGKYSVCLSLRHGGVGSPTAQVRVEADGYGAIRQDVIDVGDIHLDFKLVPEAVLVGRVTTSDGQPVAGARVVASATPPALTIASGWTTSDRDGKFRIAGLAPAAFDVFARAQGFGSTMPVSVVASPRRHERSTWFSQRARRFADTSSWTERRSPVPR